MPRLLMMRHAKSSRDDPELGDYDRPLNERGRNAAAFMGGHLSGQGLVPERILCSSARRTRQTLSRLLDDLDGEIEVRLMRGLYEASASDIVDAVAALGGSRPTMMVIGHNPALQAATVSLIGTGNPMLVRAVETQFSTAAVAVIDFDNRRWSDIRERDGRIVAFFRPRDLMRGGTASGRQEGQSS